VNLKRLINADLCILMDVIDVWIVHYLLSGQVRQAKLLIESINADSKHLFKSLFNVDQVDNMLSKDLIQVSCKFLNYLIIQNTILCCGFLLTKQSLIDMLCYRERVRYFVTTEYKLYN